MDAVQSQSGLTFVGYWLRIKHYRWVFLGLVFVGWLLATISAWLLPPKYRSETVILVEQQRIPAHYVEPNVAADLQQRLQSMSEQILSRTRLLAIVDKFHLYARASRDGDVDGLIDRMRKNIDIELIRTKRDDLSAFKVSYSHSDPAVAQQIAGELTSLFINENLRNREQLSEDTTAFLENQLAEARRSLDEQEQKLRDYRGHYPGQLPEQLQGNIQILSGLQTQLQAETDSLQRSEQQRLFLQYQYRALGGAGSVKASGSAPVITVPELDQKIESLKAELTELTTKYTAQHPDVVKVQNEIASTEARKVKVIEELKSRKTSPESQDGEMSLVSDRRGMAPITLVEGQLKANELEMATNLEKRQQGEQFRMIDPPNLPQKPYWPNRPLFSVAGVGGGVILALGLIMLLEIKNPRIFREEELREIDGINIMVSIPALFTETERRSTFRRHLFEGAGAAVVLAVISAGTLVTYYKG